jgi:aspartate beta-hydroxylase
MADDPRALNAAGLQALQAGDGAAAAQLLRRAAEADPAAALLWYNLSTALAITGDAAAEADALAHALDLEPYLPHALLARGRLHETAGEPLEAAEYYCRLLAAVDPAAPQGPGFAAGLAHAGAFVTAQGDALAASLDAALGVHIDAADPESARRFAHCVEIGLGRRQVYVHQPLVLHYPYLPAEQFFERRHFPWLAELEAATPAIRAELEGLLATGGDGFAPYVAYPPGSPVNQWAGLNHNDAWAAQFLIKHGEPQPAVRALCPQTAALLDRLPLLDLPGRGPVAFFSLLKPRTRIPPHTGATNIRTIVHLPLIVPPGCRFRVGSETRPWIIGEAFAFDDSIEHEAVNDSDELRAVLILDCWNPHLADAERQLLRHYVSALEAARPGQKAFEPN